MEKFLCTKGRRALTGAAMAIVGGSLFVLSEVFYIGGEIGLAVFGAIGCLMFLAGFFIALSIIDVVRTKIVAEFNVKTNMYDIPCCVIRKKYHAVVVPITFIGLLNYIPYKTEYCLVKNMSSASCHKKKGINTLITDSGAFNVEKITRAQLSQLKRNPQILSAKLLQENEKNKRDFYRTVQKYFDSGLIKAETGSTNAFSLCKMKDDSTCVFFFKEVVNDTLMGLELGYFAIEQLNKRMISIFELCAITELAKPFALNGNNVATVTKINDENKKYQPQQAQMNLLQQQQIQVNFAQPQQMQMNPVQPQNYQPKTVITQQMIFDALRTEVKNLSIGSVVCFATAILFATPTVICAFIESIDLKMIVMTAILVGMTLSSGIKPFKKMKKIKKALLEKGFRIETSKCLDVLTKRLRRRNEYTYLFEKGLKAMKTTVEAEPNDECVLVIIEKYMYIVEIFSMKKYQLDNNLYTGVYRVNDLSFLKKKR